MREDWRKAAIDGDEATIQALLVAGVDVNSRDRYGQTALMLASMHGRDEVVRLLVAEGAALDETAKFRLSALMLAVVNQNEEIARELVDAGADTELRGSGAPGLYEKSAFDLAKHGGLDELAAYIARSRTG